MAIRGALLSVALAALSVRAVDDGVSSSRLDKRATPLTFQIVGNSGVSAQQMFLGTPNKVYVIDKTENNPLRVGNHPAWASEYTLDSNSVRALDVKTNTFCAGGSHLGDGRWINVGGNQAVKGDGDAAPDGTAPYYDYDGAFAVRLLRPCDDSSCNWVDNPSNYLKSRRWYPTLETLEDGSVIIIGGDENGGYVNSASQNNPTYEFFPSRGSRITLKLLQNTLPANLYPLTWILPSGKLLIQAGWGTALLDYKNKVETTLANIPHAVRTYPGSGATVMLPLTPANGYTATILFCGGQNLNNWKPSSTLVNHAASTNCVTMTPDKSTAWVEDATLPEGRTMGNFIYLADGKILLVNGAQKGTAGYGTQSFSFGGSYADGPRYTPVIYNPAPSVATADRFDRSGISASTVARMYHSSALLLADGSVFVAGSNPNPDYTTNEKYNSEYRTEKFYPWYYNRNRPNPSGVPSTLSYGGNYWDIKLSGADLQGYNATVAAQKAKVIVIRTGFSTHGLNMGQRLLQLNSTYTVNSDGSFTFHVSQMPPNPAVFPPGPAMLHVGVAGVPSIGKLIMVGNGQIGTQSTLPVQTLPRSK